MKILVTGGREFDRAGYLSQVLDDIHRTKGIDTLIHGDSQGADRLAGIWAENLEIKVIECPADWIGLGKKAGPIRNGQMIAMKPDLVVAFAGGKGTADCVRQAEAAGIEVRRA